MRKFINLNENHHVKRKKTQGIPFKEENTLLAKFRHSASRQRKRRVIIDALNIAQSGLKPTQINNDIREMVV